MSPLAIVEVVEVGMQAVASKVLSVKGDHSAGETQGVTSFVGELGGREGGADGMPGGAIGRPGNPPPGAGTSSATLWKARLS